MRLGFVGTGTIAQALVRGIRTQDAETEIHLSPRSAEITKRLAQDFPNTYRHDTNQSVLDKSDIVVLGMLPQQMEEVVAALRFRPDHVVISCVASTAFTEVSAMVAPARAACRITPLPPVEYGRGPIVMYPRLEEAVAIFGGLGDLVIAESEDEIRSISTVSGTMSTFFELQRTMAQWMADNNVPMSRASLYTRSLFESLSFVARTVESDESLVDPADHETRGGLNERTRARLAEAGWFRRMKEELDHLQQTRLR